MPPSEELPVPQRPKAWNPEDDAGIEMGAEI
jgi:hypothetical protein